MLLKTRLRVTKSNFKIIFAPGLVSLPVSQANLVNLYITNFFFWGGGALPISAPRIKYKPFCQFSLLDSPLCFFLKTGLQVRNSIFRIIFAPYLGFITIIWQKLLNLYLTNYGASSTNQCT